MKSVDRMHFILYNVFIVKRNLVLRDIGGYKVKKTIKGIGFYLIMFAIIIGIIPIMVPPINLLKSVDLPTFGSPTIPH